MIDWELSTEIKIIKGKENYWVHLNGNKMTCFKTLEECLNWIKTNTKEKE